MRTRTHPVGLAIPHDSAALHVSGEAIYIDDIPPPAGTLYAALGLSERAHAAFNMDLSPVGKAPGVVAVAAANDIIGENEIAPVFDGDPLFANGIVQYAVKACLPSPPLTKNRRVPPPAWCVCAIKIKPPCFRLMKR